VKTSSGGIALNLSGRIGAGAFFGAFRQTEPGCVSARCGEGHMLLLVCGGL
jgi:isoaspartyl peptidase/L-asparaginase-like protein (Ntn-hydrolase superfamily)